MERRLTNDAVPVGGAELFLEGVLHVACHVVLVVHRVCLSGDLLSKLFHFGSGLHHAALDLQRTDSAVIFDS